MLYRDISDSVRILAIELSITEDNKRNGYFRILRARAKQ